ncbi:MAG: hypothetical protein K2K82_05845 [Muribaculaceae bacterium]|nr:hypothetical protein [Muribaculaceae bacterium]
MSKYLKKEQLIALLLTLLLTALTVTMLVCVNLSPVSAMVANKPNLQDEEFFFADIEYQEITTNPTMNIDNEPASASAAEISGTDMSDAGAAEEAPTLVSTDKPSEAKVVKPEEPKSAPGLTKEEIEAQKSAKIKSSMGNKFAQTKSPSDSGTGSADSGNASAGNNPGADGLGLSGRKLESSAKPNITNASGTIQIRVTVNSEGVVTNATFVKSSASFGTREQEVREACIAASKKLKYNRDPNHPSQTGTITWNIR